VEQVEYLGHIISKQGVVTNPKKIMAVQQWPMPKRIKQLRGFFGLANYYRRFVKGYGTIAKPLTNMLKKNSLCWSVEAKAAFQDLKASLVSAPVLSLPNFSKPFVVLMPEHYPIAFISRALNLQQQSLSTYEKELLALVLQYKNGDIICFLLTSL